jgi:hypothetical protein
MALDEEKFDRWQPNLLALLNEPKLKRFARWRMGLRNRAALDEEIIAIDPHHITVPLGVNQFRSSFSSQPAIQKGLYHGFKPVFWGMHAYDWLLPDRCSQRWVQSLIRPLRPAFEGFGLKTLSVYSQAGGGGSNVTCDINLAVASPYYPGSSLGDLQSGNGTIIGYSNYSYLGGELDSSISSTWSSLSRSIMTYDTHSLTSAASVTSAAYTYSISSNQDNQGGTFELYIVNASTASPGNMGGGDWGNITNYNVGNQGIIAGNGSVTLNGQENLNKTGITCLGLMIWWDMNSNFNGYWSDNSYNTIYINSADTGSSAPCLVVTYTGPTAYTQSVTASMAALSGSRSNRAKKSLGAS